MRDWTLDDPGYSANDAGHPRNRPAGFEPEAPTAAEVATMVAMTRLALGPLGRPAAAGVPAPRARRGPRQRSQAEKAAILRRSEELTAAWRRRNAQLASLAGSTSPLLRSMASPPAPRPGHLTRWGW